jgi:glyoxylase-like metal-dependent hydrolase (beta-lactamase superfamily II)
MKTKLLLATSFIFSSSLFAHHLQYKTYVASPEGFEVTSTLVYGDKDAVLIDSQFQNSDAHKLVAMILESKKNLTTIFVTHAHPDHYWGLNVVKAAFPKAKVYARAEVVKEIKATMAGKLKYWKPIYGANVTDKPIVPTPLAGNTIALEGDKLEVSEILQGDSETNSMVWIPSLNAVVTGDVVYNNAHMWLLDAPKPEQRAAWIKSLDGLAAKKPTIVIAGHKYEDAPDSIAAIAFSKSYIETFNKLVADKADEAKIKTTLISKYPNAKGMKSVVDFVAKTFGNAR